MMLSAVTGISPIKKALKFAFSGFSLFFITMLVFMVVHDMLTVNLQQPLNIVLNMAS